MTFIEETKALAPWTESLPPDWQVTRLDTVADVFFSNVDKHTKEGEVPVRLCNYVDVYKNERITSGLDFMEASAEQREIKKFQIKRGDILATKDSEAADDIAIPALVAEDLPGVLCGYHLALIRPRFSMFNGQFLAWLHSSKSFRAQYEAKAVGVTRFGLSQYAFRAARIPLPPLPEQQHIAAYLDASCAAIDAAVAAKRRQIETLDALRRSIIHKAVTCGLSDAVELKDSGAEWLGKMPVHWQIKRIKDIVDLKSGDAITSDSITPIGDYPVFGGNGLRGYTNSYNYNGYYVLIGRQGALCGNINYAEGKFWASEHAVAAITLKKHNTFWLGELLRVMNLNQYSNAAAQPGLAVERIKFLRIPIPPYEEQNRIASWIKNTTIKNEKIVSILRKQIATLTAYRKSLIHECVTGQRRITEADVAQAHRGMEAK